MPDAIKEEVEPHSNNGVLSWGIRWEALQLAVEQANGLKRQLWAMLCVLSHFQSVFSNTMVLDSSIRITWEVFRNGHFSSLYCIKLWRWGSATCVLANNPGDLVILMMQTLKHIKLKCCICVCVCVFLTNAMSTYLLKICWKGSNAPPPQIFLLLQIPPETHVRVGYRTPLTRRHPLSQQSYQQLGCPSLRLALFTSNSCLYLLPYKVRQTSHWKCQALQTVTLALKCKKLCTSMWRKETQAHEHKEEENKFDFDFCSWVP